MPLRHVVTFTWNDDVPPDHDDAVSAALAELAGAIPEIRAYSFGPDLALVDGNAAFAITADFDGPDGFLTYRDHPLHQQFIADHIAGRVATRAAAQFEI